MSKRTIEERFWEKVDKSNECWIWRAGKDKDGYGYFSLTKPRRTAKAHRVAWELERGPIPPGLCICHSCDNPSCVRPAHLWIGTHAQNARDRERKKLIQKHLATQETVYKIELWLPKTGEDRFWNKVNKSKGCWNWKAGKSSSGYGGFTVDGRKARAHRVSYEMAYGPIPDGLICCHHCDNPSCVRPDHLFIGTTADNVADRERKGRNNPPRGSKHGQSKLSRKDVIAIRKIYANGHISQRALGLQYGMSYQSICDIVNRKYWTHI